MASKKAAPKKVSKVKAEAKVKTVTDVKKVENKETILNAKHSLVKSIQKRNGSIVSFDIDRIANAIHKAMLSTGEGSEEEAELVANKVYADVVRIAKKYSNFIPTVEGIQDSVEKELILSEYVKTAKSYILYRAEHAKQREKHFEIPEKVKRLAAESKKSFRNPLGEFIYYRTYSRWIEEEGRRETWVETVDRYISFMRENLGSKLKESEYKEVREAIFKHEAMPSMRLLQFAGPAARKNHSCAYNCSFTAPQSFQDFAEIMFLSMSGCGVGFSAESYSAQSLPQIKYQTGKVVEHTVGDSREGWADSFAFGMEQWFMGNDVKFDYSLLRPAGARLKTTGGKSSGPDPLRQIHDFTRSKILARQGQHLSNLDVHDIVCMIGMGVVSGGVRRTALISLSDLDDEKIRDAKKGQFYISEPQRSLANNSAVYTKKPTNTEFLEEWISLVKSGSGERGIFNRGGLPTSMPARRVAMAGEYINKFGTNPCGEIILRPKQFCNLSEIVARHTDTEKDLMRKIRIATILGTYQATFSNFIYLSPEWKKNCEAERLLGVSITGMWDSPTARKPEVLRALRAEAINVNKIYAKRFGINPSAAITTVKPSGNLSQTVDCSSGMHPRHSQYYIRRVRISATDAVFKMLKDQGVPYHAEIGQNMDNATTYVVDFPVQSPKGSIFKDDMSAIEQLEFWKVVKLNYTEHNPSVTVSIGEDEWIAVANWLYANWDIIGGLSFLPRSNHVYQLAPYEEITEKQYKELMKRYDKLDFSKIVAYEKVDNTDVKKELACAGGVCEIEDAAVSAMSAQEQK
ncbi:MAG: ATP cone domain-containing protein [Candidatus Pacebacteria bacterium]|nr:ATP cone domain-containing protein [Candidatus Paceibacterota bacterium]